jgi:hypothetical protein
MAAGRIVGSRRGIRGEQGMEEKGGHPTGISLERGHMAEESGAHDGPLPLHNLSARFT